MLVFAVTSHFLVDGVQTGDVRLAAGPQVVANSLSSGWVADDPNAVKGGLGGAIPSAGNVGRPSATVAPGLTALKSLAETEKRVGFVTVEAETPVSEPHRAFDQQVQCGDARSQR